MSVESEHKFTASDFRSYIGDDDDYLRLYDQKYNIAFDKSINIVSPCQNAASMMTVKLM